MIAKAEILEVLRKYDNQKIKIGTICSHSALQIFYGARREGFRTVGITTEDRRSIYEAFPFGKPDEYIIVDKYLDLIDQKFQSQLFQKNVIIIPHGSFVEYVGPENLKEKFKIPIFGNRNALEFEGDRSKMRLWLQDSKVKVPDEYSDPAKIDRPCIVKFHGARGGKGFFVVDSEETYQNQIEKRVKNGAITEDELKRVTIQEIIIGVRYYPHYFYSLMFEGELKVGQGRVELLGIDRRIESNVEDIYRIPKLDRTEIEPSYVVTGNMPVVLRESLLPKVLDMGRRVAESSVRIFPPGIIGPFCLETICTEELEFVTFEVSARIVAGTNLYPDGSPYSSYLFSEPMSNGRRMALEIKEGIRKNRLTDIIS
jgi:5-formaminoimidazole-4-carboxamide-1-(beta)-D-ribofuranosyl 5'-monophosphate synthetase